MIVMMLRGRAPTEIVCTLKDLSGVKITEEYLKHGIMGTGIPAGRLLRYRI